MKEPAPKVFIENCSFQALSRCLSHQNYTACFLLADENTARHCYTALLKSLPPHRVIQIEAGEEHKVLAVCETIWKHLTEANADRHALIINLGGGVIGDIGGFAAGCYKRGIHFINIPTTLLAMVDASVGAKTGIDFMDFKNQIGLFNPPEGVFVYTGFLQTLPERELMSGFAEVIKHSLIADNSLFEEIRNLRGNINNLNWDDWVERNIRIKHDIVSQDPHEQNIRKALNFGHTVGHAIESWYLQVGKQKLLHGEAVAAGMIAESFLSFQNKQLSKNELEAITQVILNHFQLPELAPQDFSALIKLMKQDKKNSGAEIRFTLLNGIGNYSINQTVKEDIILRSLEFYNQFLHENSEGKSSH